MSILDRIEIVCADVREVECDLLVLKYADGLYGADLAVAERMDINIHVVKGQTKLMPRRADGLGAAQVLFRGVGDLFKFRYHEIRVFGYATLVDAAEIELPGGIIATTIHGPGYVLDEREAFASQLQSYLHLPDDATEHVKKLLVVEQDAQRAERLVRVLEDVKLVQSDPFADLFKQELSATDTAKPLDTFGNDAPFDAPLGIDPPAAPIGIDPQAAPQPVLDQRREYRGREDRPRDPTPRAVPDPPQQNQTFRFL